VEPKLSTAQRSSEMLRGQWVRFILWYRKYPSDQSRKKTFYERSQVDDFLSENPDYIARRIDKHIQTIIWMNEEI
jgi:hypothetical protein